MGSRLPGLRITVALMLTLAAAARGEDEVVPPEDTGGPVLEEIVVTAQRRATTELETTQHVSVVTATEIREQGGQTTPDALDEEPGVWVQKTALGGGAPFIRGLTGKQVLILVDGVRLNNSTFRYGPNQYLNTIDPGIIRRIEVVRGPGSVMYGSDALGGVINIITDRGSDPSETPAGTRFAFSEQFSSANLGSMTRLDVDGASGTVLWALGVGYKHFGDLRAGDNGPSPVGAVDIDGVQPYTGYDEVNANASMRWRIAPGSELSASYQFTRQDDVPRSDKMIESAYNTTPEEAYFYDPQQTHFGSIKYESRDLGAFDSMKLDLSYNHQLEGRERRKSGWTKTRFEEDEIGTIGFGAQFAMRPAKLNTLTAGLEYYSDSISSTRYEIADGGGRTDLNGRFPDGSTYDSFGLYVRDKILLTDGFSIAVGGRYSSYDVEANLGGTVVQLTSITSQTFSDIAPTYSDFTWSFEALYDVGSDSTMYLNIARGFRAPNMDDLAADGDWNAGKDIPNPDIRPEVAISYEIGLKHIGAGASGGASLFYSDYTDFIEREYYATGFDDTQGTTDDIFRMENVGEAEIYGFEVWGKATVSETLSGHWSVSGQLAYARGRDLTDDEPLRRMPPLNGNVGMRWDGNDRRRWVELLVEVAAEQDDLSPGDIADNRIPTGGTPGWATINLRGGVDLGHGVSLTAGLHNIGDERYRVHGSGVDAPGVNLVLGIRWMR